MVYLVSGSAFAAYDNCPFIPLLEAEEAMVGDSDVSVTEVFQPWPAGQANNPQFYYEFKPVGISPETGFIFYPGGTVSAAAYAPMAREIAKAGFFVALVPMPDCLAIFGVGRADEVINNNPGITTWAIGGHSFGGVGACWYVSGNYSNNNKIKGIVLWASYPDAAQPINTQPVKVISLWGTKDALTTEQKINDSKPNLPIDTYYVKLNGANHVQFGWIGQENNADYDFLGDDNPADISRQEQQDLIVSYTVNFLDSLLDSIDKCTVKAGKNGKGDSIKFSGFLNATVDDFFEADSVIVTIETDDLAGPEAITYEYEIDEDSFKKGKYKSPKVKPLDKSDPKTSLQIDSIKGKMKFAGKNLDLTGFSCPITVTIQIGDYVSKIAIGEDVVNGTKPCPPELMEGI